MTSSLDQFRPQLKHLCLKYHVKRLELFGSTARGENDPAKSDIDLLVLFDRSSAGAPGRYLELLLELERLFNRKVDLVDINAARNPYFIAEALRNRVQLYAA